LHASEREQEQEQNQEGETELEAVVKDYRFLQNGTTESTIPIPKKAHTKASPVEPEVLEVEETLGSNIILGAKVPP
jgi:hypothetical protein